MKRKIKSPTWFRKRCVQWAKDEAKTKAGYVCEHCGASKAQGYQMHGSHILAEGSHPIMSDRPENILCLCAKCHVGGMWDNSKNPSWHDDPMYFAGWFNNKWPNRYKELLEQEKELCTHVVNWPKRWEEIKEV